MMAGWDMVEGAKMYADGKTIYAIAKHFNEPYMNVYRKLRALGIKLRRNEEQNLDDSEDDDGLSFKEATMTPYVRRRSWPLGEFAKAKFFREKVGTNKGGKWYWERKGARHSTFYGHDMAIPGEDWERCDSKGKPL